MTDKKKFLITGGTGFLGKNLRRILIENNHDVDWFGSEYNLSDK